MRPVKRKKKKLKFAVRKAMSEYYEKGLTTTASKVRTKIWNEIEKIYNS